MLKFVFTHVAAFVAGGLCFAYKTQLGAAWKTAADKFSAWRAARQKAKEATQK